MFKATFTTATGKTQRSAEVDTLDELTILLQKFVKWNYRTMYLEVYDELGIKSKCIYHYNKYTCKWHEAIKLFNRLK